MTKLDRGTRGLTIEDLKNLRDCHAQIASLKGRIARLRASLSSAAAPRLSFAPHGSSAPGDPVGNGTARLTDMEVELQERIVELEKKIRRVEVEIENLPPRERTIIRARYADGLSWRKVGKAAGYCEEHCKRIDALVRHHVN